MLWSGAGVQEICNSVYRESEVAGMDKEKRFCPFKSSMQVDYRNGARNVRNLFVRCSGSKCMAYKNGGCLRLGTETKKKER